MLWSEIRNDFEDEGVTFIDAWETDSDGEVGTVIAKVYSTPGESQVQYLDERARTDDYAQEVIRETLDDIKNRVVS